MKMVAFAAALAAAITAPVVAAPVSQTFDFAGSPTGPGGASFFLSGRISVTFNEGESVFDEVSDYSFDQAVKVPSMFFFVDYEEGEITFANEDSGDLFAIRFLSIQGFIEGDESTRATLFYRPEGLADFYVDPRPIIRFGTDPEPVPEPGAMALLGLGVLGLAALRRRHV
jgi:hypothetical protein